MFLCPGRVRWMNNNKRDNCQVINYFGMGYPETRSRGGGGQFVFRGSHGPQPSLVIWNTGNTGCGQHRDSDE